jgi:hypothetical protein
MIFKTAEYILHTGENRKTFELTEHLYCLPHQFHIIFSQRRVSDAIVRVRVAIVLIFVNLYRSIISKLIASHHLDIHLNSPSADTLVDTLVFIKGIAAGLDQVLKSPPAVTTAKAVVYGLIAN